MSWTLLAAIVLLGWWSGLARALFDGRPLFAAVLDLVLVLTAAALVRGAWLGRRWRNVDPILLVAVGAYAVFAAAQMLNPNVPDFVTALEGFRKSAFTVLAFFVAAFAASNGSLRMYRIVAIGSVVAIVWGIRQFFAPLPAEVGIVGTSDASLVTFHAGAVLRAFSPTSGPFHFGILAGAVALMALVFAARRSSTWLIVVAVAGIGLALSLTRANLLATAVATAALAVLGSASVRRRVAGMAVLATAVVLGLSIGTGIVIDPPRSAAREAFETPRPTPTPTAGPVESPIPARSSSPDPEAAPAPAPTPVLPDPLDDRNLQFRFAYWSEQVRAILERPVLGYGTSSASDGFEHRFEPAGLKHFAPHSMYTKPALELGLLGFALFVLILLRFAWLAVRGSRRGRPEAVVVLGLLVLTMVSGITGPMLDAYPFNVLFWASAGVAARRDHHGVKASEFDGRAG